MKKRTVILGAVTALSVCVAACSAVLGPDAGRSPAALFDSVWNDFDLHYSLFAAKHINWDSLRAVYRPQAISAQDDENVSKAIGDMLSKLTDDHVAWRGSRVGTPRWGDYIAPTITYGKYIQLIAALPGGVSYGFASATVGYIAINGFTDHGWLSSVDSAVAGLGALKCIIIDVRNNEGGLFENAAGAAGRFADRKTTIAYVRYRNGPRHTDFAPAVAQEVAPAGSHRFLGKIILLTSRNTVSAAELFVLSMRALGHTTVVGDTTAGETGSPLTRELQNGWIYQIPESLELTLDGNTFEGIGLPPDEFVFLKQSQVDAQMERAIALANAQP